MSHVDSEIEKVYVATYKELIFTFIVFSIILIVLYPKDLLKEQILAEKSNYDLSMLYLENLLEHDPNNESLMLILAEQSLRTGKKDLSLRLLELLLYSEIDEYRNKATLLSYDLKKDDYYYLKTEKEKESQKESLSKLLFSIYTQKMYDEEDSLKWYEESRFLEQNVLAYQFLQFALKKDPTNPELLESGYYYAIEFKDYSKAISYNELLILYDKENQDKWVMSRYYTFLKAKEYDKAEKILLSQYERSQDKKKYLKKLADFYLMRKSYKKSSQMYMDFYEESSSYKEKRGYYFKAVDALRAGNYLDESAELAHRYENQYLGDAKVRKYLLKLYMASGNLDYAARLSKKVLTKELR